MAAGKITLRDNVFSKGSACITPEAKAAFSSVEKNISSFLGNIPEGQIFVEGHTDNIPVSRPVTDFLKFCTVYDDNYTLSAARAREARNLLVGGLAADTARRIVVAGYGDSHPVAGIDPADARNRRVEVRFVISENGK
jgi:chemotaxis protein MotB